MIKNIVFDFGGVIVDIDRDKAVQAFIKLGLADADTRLDKYHQTGIFQELEEGKLSADGQSRDSRNSHNDTHHPAQLTEQNSRHTTDHRQREEYRNMPSYLPSLLQIPWLGR